MNPARALTTANDTAHRVSGRKTSAKICPQATPMVKNLLGRQVRHPQIKRQRLDTESACWDEFQSTNPQAWKAVKLYWI